MNVPGGKFMMLVFAGSFVCSIVFLTFGFYLKD
jgi:hypothetical protein